MSITKAEIKAMSVEERDELLSTLWDVIDEVPYSDNAREESDEEKNILREELEEYKRDPSSAKTWEQVLLELRSSING